jgi:hypothetical protein
VLFIGLPSALWFKNWTALALSIGWLVPEFNWMLTGNSFPLYIFVCADISVMAVIFAKAIVRAGPKIYPTFWAQLTGFKDVSVCDWCIVGLFLLGAWPIYVSDLHEYYRFWYLLYISVAQFLLAGVEALQIFLRQSRARSAYCPADNGLAYAGRIGGYA